MRKETTDTRITRKGSGLNIFKGKDGNLYDADKKNVSCWGCGAKVTPEIDSATGMKRCPICDKLLADQN